MKIACLGSSSVEGVGDQFGLGWVGRISCHLAKNNELNKYRVFNLGLKGEFLDGTIERYKTEVLKRRPHLVLIFTGTNDCSTYTDEDGVVLRKADAYAYLDKWNKFADILKSAEHQTIILGPTMVDESKGPETTSKGLTVEFKSEDVYNYHRDLKLLCEKHELRFLDLYELFANDLSGNASDFVHPNETGYDLIFNRIMDYLEEEGLLDEK